jgi:hypothetical protein
MKCGVLVLCLMSRRPAAKKAVGDDWIERGDALQARGQVWRLAHDPAFLGLPGADEISDPARRDGDAHPERPLDAQLAVASTSAGPVCTARSASSRASG